jgi:outer membrane protein TolC
MILCDSTAGVRGPSMKRFVHFLTVFCLAAFALCGAPAGAEENVRIEAAHGKLGWVTRPYQSRYVPPVNLANSTRLDSLIRAGNLYLTAQDVVALALENNIDIEIQRYGPLLAREILRRAQAGGLLRTVGLAVSPGPTSVSLQGVSVNTSGLNSTAGTGVSSSGGIVTQLGPQPPSLDPAFSVFTQFQHVTSPQSNTFLIGTNEEVETLHTYQFQYSQSWLSGTSAQVTWASQYTKINSELFSLNPFQNGYLDFQVTQNLLYGFGAAVNGRNIRIQKNNMKVTDLQFKQQVETTISSVLNLYWDLVAYNQELQSRNDEVRVAQQLLDNNREQVRLGTLAEIEVTRAQSQLYAAKQDQLIAQTNLVQQEAILKNALSRSGIASPDLANIHIVPLDRMTAPPSENLPSIEQAVATALQKRPELEQARLNIDSKKIGLVGIRNELRPTLQAFAEVTNNGLTGTPTEFGLQEPGIGYFSGGYSNLVSQVFRRNFPNYSAGFSLNIPLRNRAAQSDYVTSVIDIRQSELDLQKQINQVRLDVQNAIVGLQQARARLDAAAQARILSQATFDGDQKKFQLGATTSYQVVQDQRDLSSAQSSEMEALANYSHARINYDQAVGDTLEANQITIEEAKAGKSRVPPGAKVPAGVNQ